MKRAAQSPASWAAFFLVIMAFTYNFGANPFPDFVRLLISDTVDLNHIFEDSELAAFGTIASGVWQSSMMYSGADGVANLPSPPVNYLRTAAFALNALASNKARLSSVIQVLDIKLAPDKAAAALRETAKGYIDLDENSGAFVVIEQVTTDASFQWRFFNQIARTSFV